jgi:hypothetical protein
MTLSTLVMRRAIWKDRSISKDHLVPTTRSLIHTEEFAFLAGRKEIERLGRHEEVSANEEPTAEMQSSASLR